MMRKKGMQVGREQTYTEEEGNRVIEAGQKDAEEEGMSQMLRALKCGGKGAYY
jgi:hypothetical protein